MTEGLAYGFPVPQAARELMGPLEISSQEKRDLFFLTTEGDWGLLESGDSPLKYLADCNIVATTRGPRHIVTPLVIERFIGDDAELNGEIESRAEDDPAYSLMLYLSGLSVGGATLVMIRVWKQALQLTGGDEQLALLEVPMLALEAIAP